MKNSTSGFFIIISFYLNNIKLHPGECLSNDKLLEFEDTMFTQRARLHTHFSPQFVTMGFISIISTRLSARIDANFENLYFQSWGMKKCDSVVINEKGPLSDAAARLQSQSL